MTRHANATVDLFANDLFANMSDREFDAVSAMDATEIRNHLDASRSFASTVPPVATDAECVKCGGTGKWVGGYHHVVTKPCFGCNGTGRVAVKVQANASGNGDVAKSGAVGIDKINAMFQAALDAGKKKPIFRAYGLEIKIAKLHADRLYVTGYTDGAYYGKLENGRFEARREAPADTLRFLCAIAEDPKRAAKEFAHETKRCSFCNILLTDDRNGKSVERGYGPVCAKKFGMNWG